MNKRMRRTVMTAAISASLAIFGCGTALVANAAETGTAYVYLVDEAENGACYMGSGNSANTITSGVTEATIDKDGDYTVTIDGATISEFKKLKLYVVGTENTKNATITVKELTVNDKAVALEGTPEVKASDNNFYADFWDIDGA